MVGILIFVFVVVLYFEFTKSFSFETKNDLDDLVRESKLISDSLMGEGYPTNWTIADVKRIGLTNGNYRLNATKLQNFNMINYSDAKKIFSINYEFYVYFEKNGSKVSIDGIDHIGSNMSSSLDLVPMSRIIFYNGIFYEMKVVSWR